MDRTYQVKVLAGLTEEEALHAVLFGLLHHMMEGCITTPEVNGQTLLYTQNIWRTAAPPHLNKHLLDSSVLLKALKDVHPNMQIERVLSGLRTARREISTF